MLVTAGAMFTDAARRFADRPALGVPRVIWIVDALEQIGQQTEVTG